MDISIPFKMLGNDIATEDTVENRVRFLAKRIGFRDHLPTYCGLLKMELVKYGIPNFITYRDDVISVRIDEVTVVYV
ncbi:MULTISPECIES: hypothetical protein [unclassified Mesotoga]|uniref:hypothetical protein n=1 Tax=unclassified Mesotoga TaxID=1184398 RepID=UPI000DA6553F|nr:MULTISPECIES: hypothetical protein [unclassified Mesotoga]PZC52311.1 hypothetical protein LH53_05705 [Mesotoga sp. TolDC]